MIAFLQRDKRLRLIALVLFYLSILAALILMYGKGDFSTPPFIYQNF
ncbi:MAG: teichoic acid D-Ala incorporation-associated protein DltX [Chloroflexota bacterium]